MKKLTKGQVALITIVLVLIVDQAVKIWVKTHMYIGESIRVTDWFYIAFIENNGMAFGMEVGSKLFLSLFRIVAVVFLSWWMLKIKNRPQVATGFIVCLALIIAGAAGNIVDCLFYGLMFNDPVPLWSLLLCRETGMPGYSMGELWICSISLCSVFIGPIGYRG